MTFRRANGLAPVAIRWLGNVFSPPGLRHRNIVDGTSSITVTDGVASETFTFAAAENVGLRQFQHFTTFSTLAENVAATAQSLVRVMNRAAGANWYGFCSSLVEDPPGKILIRRRILNTNPHSLTANLQNVGDNFDPPLPTSGTTVESQKPGGDNRVAISKFEQPEAVPRLSTEPFGGEDDPILRCIALRDSALVFKNVGGMHVISGETDGTVGGKFVFKVRDETLRLFGRDTAVALVNAVYAYSNQGFIRADENGAEIIGRQVEEPLEAIRATANWDNLAFAVAYNSEDMYICFGPEGPNDTFPRLAWVYNTITRTFANGWRKNCSAGHVLSTDDKLYLAHAQDFFTLQERKSLEVDLRDYRDEDIDINIDIVSTTTDQFGRLVSLLTITYSYANQELLPGFVITQGTSSGQIQTVLSLGGDSYQVTLTEQISVTTGAAVASIPVFVSLKTAPIFARNPALLKQFNELHIEFESDTALTHLVGFSSDLVPIEVFNETQPYISQPTNAGWGLGSWGEDAWGNPGERSATPIIVTLPADYQRGRRLDVLYKHQVASEKVSLSQLTMILRVIGKRSSVKQPRVTI